MLFSALQLLCYFISHYGIPNISYGSVAYNNSVVFVCLNSSVILSYCQCLHVGKTKLILYLHNKACLAEALKRRL